MQLAPVMERIAVQMPDLRQVTAAASVPLAVASIKAYPAACLLMPRGQADKNQLVNAISQNVEDTFAVILAVRNVRDSYGLAASEDMDALRPTLQKTLLGWTFDAAYDPIEYVGYQLLHCQDGLLLWADHFLTRHHVRAVGAQ
jgi:hypothetical protein